VWDKFHILRVRKNNESGVVKGFADVQIGGDITIFSIKILQDGGDFFCAMPSEKFYSEVAGRELTRSIIHLPHDLRARIYERILREWYYLNLKFKKREE
jgi:DNA-binding cell septation regulator SpoVG